MIIKKIEHCSFKDVIKFLKQNFSSPTHWPDWNLLVSKYYNTEFYYFGLFESGELIGICPVHEKNKRLTKMLISGQCHFIPNGGWLMNTHKMICLSDIHIPLNCNLECFSLPHLQEFKVNYNQCIKSFYTLVISLKSSEDEIWRDSIDSKRRNMIRKANKMGIKITKDTENIEQFYSLYADSNKSNNLELLPLSFFCELLQNANNIKFIPFVAYSEDGPCGALGLIHDKNYSFYWLGATKKDSANLGQGELLQWEAILYSKEKGCTYYDLCFIEKDRLPNIYEFKKGFSKNEVEISFVQKKTFVFRVLNRLQKLG